VELDELTPNTILRAHPESDEVDRQVQADDGATNFVALVDVLADKHHDEPLPALIEQRWTVLHRQHPLPTIRIHLVLPASS